MRKWNNILARVIIALFLLHALMGSLMLLGVSSISFKSLSWLLFTAVIAHGVLGVIATVQAVKSGKTSGKWYLRQNAAYWTKRFSGLAILILLFFHISAYTTTVGGKFFLKEFTFGRMSAQLLLILSVFIHLAVSVRSMLIAKGNVKFKERTVDIMMIMSLMMLLFTAAIIIYFIQWQI